MSAPVVTEVDQDLPLPDVHPDDVEQEQGLAGEPEPKETEPSV